MAQLLDEDPTLIDAVDHHEHSGGSGLFGGSTALHMASYEGCAGSWHSF